MKTRYLLLILLIVPTFLFAMLYTPYDTTKRPILPLPVAYKLATQMLSSATNEFYCSEAKLANDSVSPMWSFLFCSTNTPPKYQSVWVYFDGKAQFAPERIR